MENKMIIKSSIPFFIIILIMIIADIFVINNTLKFLNNSEKTVGKIIEVIRKSDGDNYLYSQKFSFTDKNGQTIVRVSNTSSSIKSYKDGDSVNVLYDKTNPDNAKINSIFEIWSLSIILSIIIILMLVIGGIQIINKKMEENKAKVI